MGSACFEYLPVTFNAWAIEVVDNVMINIKTGIDGTYPKNTLIYTGNNRYFINRTSTYRVKYTLLKVLSTAFKNVSVNIKSKVYS